MVPQINRLEVKSPGAGIQDDDWQNHPVCLTDWIEAEPLTDPRWSDML